MKPGTAVRHKNGNTGKIAWQADHDSYRIIWDSGPTIASTVPAADLEEVDG